MSERGRPARGPMLALLGIAAIGQRAFLTLWRQPVLVVSTMIFPVVYLVILGNAMNRPLQLVPLAVVDEAGNAYSAECRRGVLALESGRRLVTASFVGDRAAASTEKRSVLSPMNEGAGPVGDSPNGRTQTPR